MTREHPDPQIEALFAELREVRERCARGECDAEGRETALGIALRGAVKVDPDA
jgi:hypothetical protein